MTCCCCGRVEEMAVILSPATSLGRILHLDYYHCSSKLQKLKPISPLSLIIPRTSVRAASTMSYDKELAAAKKACSLAARLCQVALFRPLLVVVFNLVGIFGLIFGARQCRGCKLSFNL